MLGLQSSLKTLEPIATLDTELCIILTFLMVGHLIYRGHYTSKNNVEWNSVEGTHTHTHTTQPGIPYLAKLSSKVKEK